MRAIVTRAVKISTFHPELVEVHYLRAASLQLEINSTQSTVGTSQGHHPAPRV